MKKLVSNQTYKIIAFILLLSSIAFNSCSKEMVTETEDESIEMETTVEAKNSKITPKSVSANGDDGNIAQNTLDGNLCW